jgi:hypothetical protein
MSARERPMEESRARTASGSKPGWWRAEESSSNALADALDASASAFLDALRALAGATPQEATR